MNKALIALACCSLTSPALACAPLSPALQGTLERSARIFKLDSALLSALIWTESHFCMRARSPVGAIGLGQLMPGTARDLGVNPHDPHQNIYGAAKYLSQMWNKFNNRALAIAAYNAGPGAVQRYRGIPPYRETQAYVRRVLSAYPQQLITMGRRLPQGASPSPRLAAQRRFAATLLTVARPQSFQSRAVRASVAAARIAATASVAMNTTLITRRNAAEPQRAVTPTAALLGSLVSGNPVAGSTMSSRTVSARIAAESPPLVARPVSAHTPVLAQIKESQPQVTQTSMASAPVPQVLTAQTRTARTGAAQTRVPQARAASALSTAPAPELASAPAQAEPFTAPTSLSLFDAAEPASGAPVPADSLNVFGDAGTSEAEAGPQGTVNLGAGGSAASF